MRHRSTTWYNNPCSHSVDYNVEEIGDELHLLVVNEFCKKDPNFDPDELIGAEIYIEYTSSGWEKPATFYDPAEGEEFNELSNLTICLEKEHKISEDVAKKLFEKFYDDLDPDRSCS